MRDWRRYAHDLEHMLCSDADRIEQSVVRAVIVELHARCLMPSAQARLIADDVAVRVRRDMLPYEMTDGDRRHVNDENH